MHNRQDGGDGILGEQLLPSENDDNKAKGVAEIFQQKTAGQLAEMDMEYAFGNQRSPH